MGGLKMGMVEIFNDNWYIFILGSILMIMYYFYSKNKRLMNFENVELALIMESIFTLLIIMTMQDKFFNEHGYFIIGLIVFCPFYAVFIWYLLNKGNYYLIESRMQGQEFYKLGLIPEDNEISKEITMQTGIRIHVMDKEVFESKKHFGDDFSPRYNAGDRIKHCDYFNGEMIFHPEYPDLRNISFWSRVIEFVALKEMIPDIMRKNLVLTDLSNVKIMKNISTMRKNLKTTLTGLEKQYEHEPFNIENKLKDYLETQIKQHHKALSESETKESIPDNETGESNND